jgi:hypothetical protein
MIILRSPAVITGSGARRQRLVDRRADSGHRRDITDGKLRAV